MKTIREIVENCAEDYYPYHEYSGAYEDKNKESLDQALKEISELLVDCKPEKPIYDNRRSPKTTGKVHGTKDFVIGYSAGVDDYENNIKARLQ